MGDIFPDVPPHILAIADQELAGTDATLTALIQRWNDLRLLHDQLGSDRVRRVHSFIASEIFPQRMLVWALLTVAIERLAHVQPEI